MRIRTIADADWPGVAALEAAVYGGSSLLEGRAALESRGRASPSTCFVLDLDDRIAGYVLALSYPAFRYPDLGRSERNVFRSPNLHLHDLAVAEQLRGRGWGSALLRQLTVAARSQRYRRISLIAVGGMETFWSAHGYLTHREVQLPPSYGKNAVYMSTALHGAEATTRRKQADVRVPRP
ncbi:GNAT family N-acetyltransferase [Streptomyces sp. NBC_00287]|uniref:GNAT family N-acetyltransferase n=1 Tax=Streptomyces sp. NBC_00287 TaxID=2975702 RepID=UPI002E27C52C|nr:GNAT family N-acetyltransferase [Streptomyces sp. NBC_00287]